MASIKDVAKLAGVSWMTVSRVINQPERVGEQTREKVQKAIAELDYVPYESAKKMRSRASAGFGEKTIVVLALDVATTPFSVDILYAIENTLKKHGWYAVVINTSQETPSEDVIDKVLAQRPAGIIYTTMGLRQVSVPERLHSVPIVLANCTTDSYQCACYIPDDRLGQYQATREVIRQGRKRLLYLTLPDNIPATPQRKLGFVRAVDEHSFPIDTRIESLQEPVDYMQAIDMIERALAQGFDFDALLCGNDRMALVVQMYLLSKGVRIPQDVLVVGYDNMPGMAELFYPTLTTVELPHRAIGHEAALHIVEQRDHHRVIALDCPLVMP